MNQPQLGHRARKRFGQNFLIDRGVIENITRAIAPRYDDNMVEIGPGKGAITELLLDACPSLNVIELDRDLIPPLQVRFCRHPGFKIHQADALKFDFAQLAQTRPLRIVGNLPYNISTPLIFHLLSFQHQIEDMHFMLQKEVVQRLCATPGEKAYGRLGIMVQYYCSVESLFEVPPQCFRPQPKVDSAIVRLTPHRQLPYRANNTVLFEQLVKTAFQQRRKTLRNALKQLVPVQTIENIQIDITIRPENLTLEELVSLSNTLDTLIPSP